MSVDLVNIANEAVVMEELYPKCDGSGRCCVAEFSVTVFKRKLNKNIDTFVCAKYADLPNPQICVVGSRSLHKNLPTKSHRKLSVEKGKYTFRVSIN